WPTTPRSASATSLHASESRSGPRNASSPTWPKPVTCRPPVPDAVTDTRSTANTRCDTPTTRLRHRHPTERAPAKTPAQTDRVDPPTEHSERGVAEGTPAWAPVPEWAVRQ